MIDRSDLEANSRDGLEYRPARSLRLAGYVLLLLSPIILAIAIPVWMSYHPSAPTVEPSSSRGYADGLRGGRAAVDASGSTSLSSSQVDSVVDEAVRAQRDQVYSRGNEYGEAFVNGMKAGARQRIDELRRGR